MNKYRDLSNVYYGQLNERQSLVEKYYHERNNLVDKIIDVQADNKVKDKIINALLKSKRELEKTIVKQENAIKNLADVLDDWEIVKCDNCGEYTSKGDCATADAIAQDGNICSQCITDGYGR